MSVKIMFIIGVGVLATILVFTLIMVHLSRKKAFAKQAAQKLSSLSLVDDFSGDNRCETELDLAKAYIELHQNEKAKQLLKSVTTHGDPNQILEARKMFTLLLKQERLI